MNPGRLTSAVPRLVAAGFCALVLAACSEEQPAPAPPATPPAAETPADPAPSEPEPPQARSYTVRGEIVSLPKEGDTRTELRIKHEAIDTFMRGDKVVGMNAMTMPFPVAEGVSLEGLAVGDKVEFEFEVQLPSYRITRITKLPADTVLEFRKANPPAQ